MPIYEYACEKCGHRFEALVRTDAEQTACPQCDGKRLLKQFSVPAAHSARPRGLPVCDVAASGGCGRSECASGVCPFE